MGRLFLGASLLQVPVLFATSAMAQQQPGYHYGPGMMGDGWWFGMMMGSLMMIIFIAAVIVLVVVAIRWFSGGGTHRLNAPSEPRAKTPLDILKERFAHGEIDNDEFEERRRALGE